MAFAIVPAGYRAGKDKKILVGVDTGATNTRFEGRELNNGQISEHTIFSGKLKTNDFHTYPDLLSAVQPKTVP